MLTAEKFASMMLSEGSETFCKLHALLDCGYQCPADYMHFNSNTYGLQSASFEVNNNINSPKSHKDDDPIEVGRTDVGRRIALERRLLRGESLYGNFISAFTLGICVLLCIYIEGKLLLDKIRTFISPPTHRGHGYHDGSRDHLASFVGTSLETEYCVGNTVVKNPDVDTRSDAGIIGATPETGIIGVPPKTVIGKKSRSSTFKINVKLNKVNPKAESTPNPVEISKPVSISAMMKETNMTSESPSQLLHNAMYATLEEEDESDEEDEEDEEVESGEDDKEEDTENSQHSNTEEADESEYSDKEEAAYLNVRHQGQQQNLHRILGPFEVLMHQAELCFDPELRLSHGLSIPANEQYFCYLALRVSDTLVACLYPNITLLIVFICIFVAYSIFFICLWGYWLCTHIRSPR